MAVTKCSDCTIMDFLYRPNKYKMMKEYRVMYSESASSVGMRGKRKANLCKYTEYTFSLMIDLNHVTLETNSSIVQWGIFDH
jgi:hypothetical protein